MDNSLLQIRDFGTKEIEQAVKTFTQNPNGMAEFVEAVKREVLGRAVAFIGDVFTSYDMILQESAARRKDWDVVRHDTKSLLTSIGEIRFSKTLFRNKHNGERKYLLDDFLGAEAHERLSEDAEAALLEEAVQTSYRRGGMAVSILDTVSKETVKDKIHALDFPPEKKHRGRKRIVEYLFIDADEDHIALQFQEKKGDLQFNAAGRKCNGAISKLVYVYEGIEPEAPKSKRHRLINPHYFGGTYDGEKNKLLWDEVYAYLENTYDLSKVKKIYLNGDGGEWIKSGGRRLHGVTYALDEFHMREYLIQMTRHLQDSAEEAQKVLISVIKEDTKEEFLSYTDMLMEYAETDSERRYVQVGTDYLLNNWMAAKVRLTDRKVLRGCSAEGHVSHVLSARMSRGPMGWSRRGVDKMSRLRAYKWNGGDMLALVRHQRQAPKVKVEKDVLSATEIISSEHNGGPTWGRYVDNLQVETSAEIKKIMSIGMYDFIWRLR
jgi:hypothetical protein